MKPTSISLDLIARRRSSRSRPVTHSIEQPKTHSIEQPLTEYDS